MNRTQNITTYSDIDWPLLWQNSRAAKSWKSKNAKEWDKKSAAFAQRTKHSPYVAQFLTHVKATPEMTVLDVGCGPGTLALPYARRVAEVTAIDYSEGMLSLLQEAAELQNIENIRAVKCSWEDDWDKMQIGSYDLVIASRSMNIDNLAAGIEKLNRHARKQVVIADRIAPSPFDPDVFAAIGREFNSGPDYIYTLNMLYQLNIHPRIEHIELAGELSFANMDDALQSYRWMFRDLTSQEEQQLKAFISSRVIREDEHTLVIKKNYPQRWALFSWMKGS